MNHFVECPLYETDDLDDCTCEYALRQAWEDEKERREDEAIERMREQRANG